MSDPLRGAQAVPGQRPILILSHDVFNERSGTVIAVAMTSQQPRARVIATVSGFRPTQDSVEAPTKIINL